MRIQSLLITIMSLLMATSTYANTPAVYKSKDTKGVTLFSDKASANSKKVTLPPENIVTVHKTKISNKYTNSTTEVEQYTVLITSPIDGETLRNNQGIVTLNVSTTPYLTQGLYLQAFSSNTPISKKQQQTSFNINNLNRGKHNINIKLTNELGKIIAYSENVTIYMHRASIN